MMMQQIQIIKSEGAKAGDLMLELSNTHISKRGQRKWKLEKQHMLDICGKVLSTSTNSIRHKMYHSAERPYVQMCLQQRKKAHSTKLDLSVPEVQSHEDASIVGEDRMTDRLPAWKHNLMVHIRKHTDVLKVENTGKVIIIDEAFTDKLEPSKSPPSIDRVSPAANGGNRTPERKSQIISKGKKRLRWLSTCLDCRRKFTDYELIRHLNPMVKEKQRKVIVEEKEFKSQTGKPDSGKKSKALKTVKPETSALEEVKKITESPIPQKKMC
ncbi:hypothetical protein Btru_077959 [Bulinus truncatus]|nr:hypothetical protein Btru_077959 [Bulinus truncatus]